MSLSGKDVPQSSDVRHKKNNPGIIMSTRSKLQPRFLHADVFFFSFSFFSLVLVMRPIYYVFKPAGPGKVG